MCYHPATTNPPAPAYVTKEDCTTGTVGTPDCEYLNPWNVGDCGLVDCSSNPN